MIEALPRQAPGASGAAVSIGGTGMTVERSRIHLLTGGLALALSMAAGARHRSTAQALPEITVFKNPT
jgi:hypothetical protein